MPGHDNCVVPGCPNRRDWCKWGLFPGAAPVAGRVVYVKRRLCGSELSRKGCENAAEICKSVSFSRLPGAKRQVLRKVWCTKIPRTKHSDDGELSRLQCPLRERFESWGCRSLEIWRWASDDEAENVDFACCGDFAAKGQLWGRGGRREWWWRLYFANRWPSLRLRRCTGSQRRPRRPRRAAEGASGQDCGLREGSFPHSAWFAGKQGDCGETEVFLPQVIERREKFPFFQGCLGADLSQFSGHSWWLCTFHDVLCWCPWRPWREEAIAAIKTFVSGRWAADDFGEAPPWLSGVRPGSTVWHLTANHIPDFQCLDTMYVSRLPWNWHLAIVESGYAFMPDSFRQKYPSTRVIIDGTEFHIEKLANPNVQASTWSNYKNTNTLKLLVGVTPNGVICFLSNLWGGRISDK